MMTMTISLVVASSLLGTGHCGHDQVRSECSVCSEEDPVVLRQVMKLQTASHWIARRKAARVLSKYDWKCHPEAAEALADALLHDDKALVRQEAAEALAKMKPCLPAAHEAVAKAARCDDCFLTRLWAKKALKAIGKSCEADCSICGPSEDVEIEPGLPIAARVRRPRRWIPRSSRSLADDPYRARPALGCVSFPAGNHSARTVDRTSPGRPTRPGPRRRHRRSTCRRFRRRTPRPRQGPGPEAARS